MYTGGKRAIKCLPVLVGEREGNSLLIYCYAASMSKELQ